MPDGIALAGQVLGTLGLFVTALGGLVAVWRSWRRGPSEDKQLEAEIQSTVTAMADRWLKNADERLKATEDRAEEAERKASALRAEFDDYRRKREAEVRRMVDHLVAVHDWIDSGMKPPPPSRPAWVPLRRVRS